MTPITAIRRWIAERRRRAGLRRLLDHDDRVLRDIGLFRGDVQAALALPMARDAREAARAGSRLSLDMAPGLGAPSGASRCGGAVGRRARRTAPMRRADGRDGAGEFRVA